MGKTIFLDKISDAFVHWQGIPKADSWSDKNHNSLCDLTGLLDNVWWIHVK